MKRQTPLHTFECPGGGMTCAFSPDGVRAAAVGALGTVLVWDTVTGQLVRSLEPHAESLGIAFSPDGLRIASSSLDGTVRVREIATGRDLWPRVEGHGFHVGSLALAGTKALVTASEDGTCRVWSTGTGREERRLVDHEPRPLHGVDPAVTCVSATLDGHSAAIGRSDGTVRFVDPIEGSERRVFHPGTPSVVTGLAIASDGRHAFGGDDRFGVKLWDQSESAEDEVPFDDLELGKGGNLNKKCFSVALSSDGRSALGGGEGRVVVWDVEHRRSELELTDSPGPVASVAFNPVGDLAASASADRAIRLWDLARLRRRLPSEARLLRGHEGTVEAVVFFPDGERIASASKDRTIRIWQTRTGSEVDRIDLRSSADHAMSLAVSPDGRSLYAGTARGVILRFDVAVSRSSRERTRLSRPSTCRRRGRARRRSGRPGSRRTRATRRGGRPE